MSRKLFAGAALGLCLAAPAHADAPIRSFPQERPMLTLTCQLSGAAEKDTVQVYPHFVAWSGSGGAPESIFRGYIDGDTIYFQGAQINKTQTGMLVADKVSGGIDRKTGQLFWGRIAGQCQRVK